MISILNDDSTFDNNASLIKLIGCARIVVQSS